MKLKPELKGALLALLGVVVIVIGIWICIGIRIGIWMPSQYERYNYLTQNMPVAYLLWHGKIKAGDDAEKLITAWRPHSITRYDSWIAMDWYPGGRDTNFISLIGMAVLAKDGKLVAASSYADDGVDQRIFFDTLTPADKTAERAALKAYVNKIQAEREKNSSVNLSR